MTYITISHRPTLKAFHDRILTIGDGKAGFTLVPIDHSLEDRQTTTYSSQPLATASMLQPQSVGDKVQKQIVPRGTFQRLARLLQIGLPKAKAASSIGGITAAVVVQAAMLVKLTTHSSSMMSAIFKQAAFFRSTHLPFHLSILPPRHPSTNWRVAGCRTRGCSGRTSGWSQRCLACAL